MHCYYPYGVLVKTVTKMSTFHRDMSLSGLCSGKRGTNNSQSVGSGPLHVLWSHYIFMDDKLSVSFNISQTVGQRTKAGKIWSATPLTKLSSLYFHNLGPFLLLIFDKNEFFVGFFVWVHDRKQKCLVLRASQKKMWQLKMLSTWKVAAIILVCAQFSTIS